MHQVDFSQQGFTQENTSLKALEDKPIESNDYPVIQEVQRQLD